MSVFADIAQTSRYSRWPRPVSPGVSYLRTAIVNVCFVQALSGRSAWCLVDTGMPFYAASIIQAAESLYGKGSRPQGIILTHGHFDHVGGVRELSEYWDVPIYAHELELPYLTGKSSYPPPDPTVGGGLMASLSWTFPSRPIDLTGHIFELPLGGEVPGLAEWRWVHSPGHTPGHISLFRSADRTLIAGDAFVNVRQEALTHVLAQSPEIHGPPAYFTTDWIAAERSIRRLEELEPLVAITGHGLPAYGEGLTLGLRDLLSNFDQRVVPEYGRYVEQGATADRGGIVSVPPDVPHPVRNLLCGAVLGFMVAQLMGHQLGRSPNDE